MNIYEHRTQPLLPFDLFMRRVFSHALVGFALLRPPGIGILGYHFIEGLSWIDAILTLR